MFEIIQHIFVSCLGVGTTILIVSDTHDIRIPSVGSGCWLFIIIALTQGSKSSLRLHRKVIFILLCFSYEQRNILEKQKRLCSNWHGRVPNQTSPMATKYLVIYVN